MAPDRVCRGGCFAAWASTASPVVNALPNKTAKTILVRFMILTIGFILLWSRGSRPYDALPRFNPPALVTGRSADRRSAAGLAGRNPMSENRLRPRDADEVEQAVQWALA